MTDELDIPDAVVGLVYGDRRSGTLVSAIDKRLLFGYKPPISLTLGRDLETHLIAERVRFLRAGLVTPLPGGPGIVPSGTTTGARGAPLKRG